MKDFLTDVLIAGLIGIFIAIIFMYVLPSISARVGYTEAELQNATRINAYDEYLERKANPQ